MKTQLRTLSLLTTVLAITALPAYADTTPGWYTGVGAGLTFTPDATASTSPSHNTVAYDTGWNANLSGGYAWDCGFRLEGEVMHSRAAVDTVSGTTSGHGRLSNTDLFLNALYDFNLDMMMTPYIGAGVGVAFPSANNIGALTGGGSINDDSAEFAYQAIAGVAAQLDRNWAVTADYRYIQSEDADLSVTSTRSANLENSSHNIVVGLRYSYGSAPLVKASAPAVRPAAPAKAAVAPVPQSYMVFFDFDKSVLTDEAKQILASAAEDFKSGKYVSIQVTGHTDTVGTAQYNKGLSGRRAAAVKAELARLGVASNVVSASGAGKSSLLVPTADGVREAQNRRAEIVLKK